MKFPKRQLIIWGIIASLVLLRFFHLGEKVDDPHAWRQYDTKQYIEGYYYDNVPFLEPTVCWMGQHKTLILEFPLPEYLVAQIFKITGPSLIVTRLFFLLFFALALLYFHKALRLIFDNYVPELAALVAGIVPLSLFYSRAIHIDFFVIALAMAMLYFIMKFIRSGNWWHLLIGFLCGSLGLLIKAPYVFYLALPILYFAYSEGKLKWFLIRSPIFLISGCFLFIWIQYSKSTNAQIPDWTFIPNFNKFTDMSYWYFGTWHQRTVGANWTLVFERIYTEISGVLGTLLLLAGIIFSRKNKSYWWSIALLLGTLLYLLIFFNLNVIHNYYQLPFVMSCSLFVAMGIQWIYNRLTIYKSIKYASLLLLPALISFQSIRYAELNYYETNKETQKVAQAIKDFSTREDAIIVCYGGLTPQCPLILQEAGRYGWSIPIHDFSPELAYKLYQEAGATQFAVYVHGYFPEGQLRSFYEFMKIKKSVQITDEMVLYLCVLDLEPPKNSTNSL